MLLKGPMGQVLTQGNILLRNDPNFLVWDLTEGYITQLKMWNNDALMCIIIKIRKILDYKTFAPQGVLFGQKLKSRLSLNSKKWNTPLKFFKGLRVILVLQDATL